MTQDLIVTQAELKPCPFCGGEGKVKYWRGGVASGVPYSVECADWRCPSKTRSDGPGPVIEAWNTRTSEQATAQAEWELTTERNELRMLLVRFGDLPKIVAHTASSIAWRETIEAAFAGRCLKCGGTHLDMTGDCMGPPKVPRWTDRSLSQGDPK